MPDFVSKSQEIESLISRIWYQVPRFSVKSAMPSCDNPKCLGVARGGGECAGCLTLRLGRLTGQPEAAANFLEHLLQLRRAERTLMESALK